jgi:Tol biopolymer transport system component/C-terminal processing protease CtpA/Prc
LTIILLTVAILATFGPAIAGEPDSKPYFRHPAISAGGETVAFSHGGDIYTVPSSGGAAKLVVADTAFDSHPSFSPDGRYLAFTSSRSGGGDVYTLDLESGDVTRLTYHSSADTVEGWGPDSQWVYFSAQRRRVFYNVDVFKVPVEGGGPVAVVDDLMAEEASSTVSPDGREIAFVETLRQRLWFRRGPFNEVPNEIWIKSNTPETVDYRLLSSMKAKSLWPMWAPDGAGIYFVSDLDQQDGHENLFFKPLGGGETRKLTDFDSGRIFWPDLARSEGSIVFEHEFEIWRWSPGSGAAPIDIEVETRKPPDPQSVSTMENGISDFDVSPDNERVAFILHGEVFLGPLDGAGDAESTANISNTPQREASLSWAADGEGLVYTSDRSGDPDIFYYDLAAREERRLSDSPQRELFPVVSPDGRWCAYYRGIHEIRLLDLRDGSDSLLAEGLFLKDTAYDYGTLSWSPDSKWVAFVDSDTLNFRNVKVVNIHAKEAQQISFLPNVTAFYIHWAPDGSFIVFTSGSFTRYRHLFRIDLTEKPGSSADAKPYVKLELDGIKDRLHRLNTYGDKAYGLGLTPDGKSVVTYMSAFGESNLYAIPTAPTARQPLEKLASSSYATRMRAARDDESFWYLSQGKIYSLPYAGGSPKTWLIPAELEIDFHREKLQVFTEAWRIFFDCWPEKDFNGLDWREVYERYLPHARGAQTYEDLSTIIEIMMGELNASHVRNDYYSGQGEPTADLGLVFDQAELERTGGYRIKEVVKGGPMDGEPGGSVAGLYLLEIEGAELGKGVNINSLLAGRAGKRLTLTLADSPAGDGARKAIVEPVSDHDARDLSYSNWIEARKAYVEERSGGRLGYVHIRDMSLEALAQLERDLDAEIYAKEGVVVDLRFNDGGFTATYMIDHLARKPSGINDYRGQFMVPHNLAVGDNFMYRPTIVLQNNHTISDGEIFLESYSHLGIGRTVGTPSTGWSLSITSKSLLNGSSLRLPWTVNRTIDGASLDEYPRYPDITVDNPIGLDWSRSDPQADTAITVLLEQIAHER